MVAAAVLTQGLTKRYGSTVALDSLDLTIEEGEVFGYLGPNGAGKSTTIELLLGFIRPTAGSATVLGLDVRRDVTAGHRRLAYVPSVADLWPSLTGEETLRLLGNLHGSVDVAYRSQLVERFELDVDKKNRAYSHGNKQKVVLVAAFASRAELLLLDEPTTGLDPLMEQQFRTCVAEAKGRGQTVLLSSHILSEVEATCDSVAMLRAGRLVDVGRLDTLRGMAAAQVHAHVRREPADLGALAGVGGVKVLRSEGAGGGFDVECDVTGDIGPLVSALSAAGVERLSTREPSLEELFVNRYGTDAR